MKSSWIVVLLLLLASSASAAAVYDMLLNTSPLMGRQAPFSLDVQLVGMLNNTAIFDNFQFGGGSPTGTPELVGGAVGDLASGFTLRDNTSFFNEFIQPFVPGTMLSFRMRFTTHQIPGDFPGQLSVAILDRSGAEIPTLGLYVVGSDVILLTNIDSADPPLQLFATDPGRSPLGGGPPIVMDAPTIVPEPAAYVLSGSSLIALALFARRHRQK